MGAVTELQFFCNESTRCLLKVSKIYVNGTFCTILAISALLPRVLICMVSVISLILTMERLVSRICVEIILSGSALQGSLIIKVL